MLPNANKKKQVHPRKIAPVRAPSNTTAIPHKVAQARKRTALDDVSNVSNVSNVSDVNNVNNVSTQIKPSGRNENIIQPPIKPLMGNENIMQQQGKPSYRNENIIQPKVKPSMGNVNIMPPQARTAMGNEKITQPQVMPLMGNVNIMPPQARLAMGNENIVPSQQVKPAVSMVTRKRALLMDRTNFSFKPTTVTEKAHDNIKPIIKNENSNLIFPPVEFNNISELDRKRSKKQRIQEWEDLDADDLYDPMTVSEYAVDIFKYLKELEIETMPKPDYMLSQTELTWRMRGILVDWLIEVHHKFRLLPETLFLAVNIIDRFLSVRVVSLVKLQLVGITGLFIAAKYEEVLAPSVKNFIYMADNGYTEAEILKAERYVLTIIDFKLCYPNPMNFLRRASKADDFDIQARTVAKYLMEISLVDYKFLSSPPSMIAAVSLYLARKMLNRTEWHANLIHYSMYTEDELRNCENLILQYLIKPIKYEQLFKKYATKRFMKASIFVKNWIAKNIKIN